MMTSYTTVNSFFTSSIELLGTVCINFLTEAAPFPSCITLTNVNEIENKLEDTIICEQLLSLLSAEEQTLFSSYTYAKRKREWLGGRLAAKTAVLKLAGQECTSETMQKLTILPSENGSPQLSTILPLEKLPALSISHSDRFAVAMASYAHTCGIDIQKISAQTERVADRFCELTELKVLDRFAAGLDKQELLTLLWTAKEALKKSILHDQPVIFKGVTLVSMDADKSYTLQLTWPVNKANKTVDVTALQIEDCMFSYTVSDENHA